MCLSKKRYQTQDAATQAIVHLSGGKPMRAYECPVCRGWHITRSVQKSEIEKKRWLEGKVI